MESDRKENGSRYTPTAPRCYLEVAGSTPAGDGKLGYPMLLSDLSHERYIRAGGDAVLCLLCRLSAVD